MDDVRPQRTAQSEPIGSPRLTPLTWRSTPHEAATRASCTSNVSGGASGPTAAPGSGMGLGWGLGATERARVSRSLRPIGACGCRGGVMCQSYFACVLYRPSALTYLTSHTHSPLSRLAEVMNDESQHSRPCRDVRVQRLRRSDCVVCGDLTGSGSARHCTLGVTATDSASPTSYCTCASAVA